MSELFPINEDPRWRVSTATAGQVEFSVPFPFQSINDIKVIKETAGVQTVLTLGVDYTLAGANNPEGGTVTLAAGAAAGDRIFRVGEAVIDRVTSIVRQGKFSSIALDNDLDRAIILLMEFRREVDRSWKAPFGVAAGEIVVGEVGRVAAFTPTGIGEGPTVGEVSTVAGIADKVNALALIKDELEALYAIRDAIVVAADRDAEIAAIGLYISQLLALHAKLTELLAIHGKLTELQAIYDNLAGILAASGHAADAETAKTGAETAQAGAEAAAAAVATKGQPLGALIDFPLDATVPPGYLKCDGSAVSRAVYPDLFAYLGTSFGAGDGSTTFNLPDIADRVKRAGGSLAGAVGSYQEDAMQRITGSFSGHVMRNSAASTDGALDTSEVPAATYTLGSGSFVTTNGATILDSGNSPGARVSDDETRVKALIVMTCIKAYGDYVNEGTADLAAIEQAYADTQGQYAALPFREFYESSEQTLTAGGALTLAHGLSSSPKLMEFLLICKIAEHGYSVGDELLWGQVQYTTSTSLARGLVAVPDETNVFIRYGGSGIVFTALDKSTGGAQNLSNGSWRLKVRAWA